MGSQGPSLDPETTPITTYQGEGDSYRLRRPKVLFIDSSVREIDDEIWQRVQRDFELVHYDCESVEQFAERLKDPEGPYRGIEAIVRTGWLKVPPVFPQLLFTAQTIPHFPSTLRLISCSGHGHDCVDLPLLSARGIYYANCPNTCSDPVANTALFLILQVYRYFSFAEHCARTSKDWKSSRALGHVANEPRGQTLGVVGMGDIGLLAAQKAAVALGMEVHYYNRRRLSETIEKSVLCPSGAGAVYESSLENLIKVSDCLLLACPLTPSTHDMLSHEQFALAKPSGLRIVNIARGKLINEDALLEAMEEEKVVGVGLDVHAVEPGVNEKLRDNYMVTLLPHIGVCSRSSWLEFEKTVWGNLESFFRTGRPLWPINEIQSQHE